MRIDKYARTAEDTIEQRAWGHYLSVIKSLVEVPGQTPVGEVQLFNLATLLPYVTAKPRYNLFLLANAVNYVSPTLPVDESASEAEAGERATDPMARARKLDAMYGSFLTDLDRILIEAVNPSARPEYQAAQKDLWEAQRELQSRQVQITDLWNHVLQRESIPAEERRARRVIWERENGYSQELGRLRTMVEVANARVGAVLRQNTPKEFWDLIKARSWFNDRGYQVPLPPSAAFDDDRFVDTWRWLRPQWPLFDLDEFLRDTGKFERKFATNSEQYDRVETTWKVKGKARWGGFGGRASGTARRLEELTQKEHFSWEVGFKRIQEVPIDRGDWFQESLFETVGKKLTQYWGPNGLLGAYPTSLIMARGTVIKVNTSSEFRSLLESHVSGGASFSWGGFSMGGSGSRDARHMKYRATSEGFLLEDDPETIRLLGARVHRPNWPSDAEKYYEPLDVSKVMGRWDKMGDAS